MKLSWTDRFKKAIDQRKKNSKKKEEPPLPELEIAGGPNHTDILISRTKKEKRCIGGPEDAERKIEWFRRIDKNVVPIEGVYGGFYQPSIDDVGSLIECRISEKKRSASARTTTPITLNEEIARLAVEALSTIQEASKEVTFDVNLVCVEGRNFVGSIPCRISLIGTSDSKIVFKMLHTANIHEEEKIVDDGDDDKEEEEEEEEVIVEAPISPLPKTSKFDNVIIEKIMKLSGKGRSDVIATLYNSRGNIQEAMSVLSKNDKKTRNAVLSQTNLMSTNSVIVKLDSREQQGNRFSLLCSGNDDDDKNLIRWPVVLSASSNRDRDVLVLVLREIAEQPRKSTIKNLSSRSISSSPLWKASRGDEDEEGEDEVKEEDDEEEEDLFVPPKDTELEQEESNTKKKLNQESFDLTRYVSKDIHERVVNTLSEQKRTVKTLSGELKESQSRVRALIRESKRMKDELYSIVKERDDLAMKMQSALSGKKALEFEKRISKLRSDLDASEMRNSELKREAIETEKRLKKENEESISALKLKLQDEAKRSSEELSSRLKTLEINIKRSEDSRMKVRKDLSKSVAQVTKLIAERNAAKQKSVSMSSELRRLLSQKLKAECKVKELQSQISELQTERRRDDVGQTEQEEVVDKSMIAIENDDGNNRSSTPQRSTTMTTPSSSSSSSSWLSRHITRKSDSQTVQLRNLVNALSDQLHDKEMVLEEKRMALRVLAGRVTELEGKLSRHET